jgi:hypothetical protein
MKPTDRWSPEQRAGWMARDFPVAVLGGSCALFDRLIGRACAGDRRASVVFDVAASVVLRPAGVNLGGPVVVWLTGDEALEWFGARAGTGRAA